MTGTNLDSEREISGVSIHSASIVLPNLRYMQAKKNRKSNRLCVTISPFRTPSQGRGKRRTRPDGVLWETSRVERSAGKRSIGPRKGALQKTGERETGRRQDALALAREDDCNGQRLPA